MATKKSAPKKAIASRPAPKPAPGWNFETIQELIRMINKSELAEVEIEQHDFRLRVSRYASNNGKEVIYAQAPQAPAVPQMQITPQVSAPVTQQASTPAVAAPPVSNTVTFKSPMIGTFYKSAGPDKPAFVKVGDVVSKGQVLCIVEAMKLFNEIESDFDGTIVKILAENATPVEYDQPLFIIQPNA